MLMNAQSSDERERQLLRLSGLLDGELERDEVARACQAWREAPECRQTWHAWAVAGDVMRSQDLARPAQRDRDFLAAMQARLAQEPVVFAPQTQPSAEVLAALEPQIEPLLAAGGGSHGQVVAFSSLRRRHAWRTPAAVAAGCAMVVGALWVSRSMSGADAAGELQAGLAAGSVAVAASDSGVLLRNAELDRYLQAHKQYAQGPALAAPGGVRQVAVTPDGR
jgi:sigma-E factor negative regulatory protein RseA